MATIAEVHQYMEQLAPSALAESWDNVGLLVDCGGAVTKILVALDITDDVIQEAAEHNCQLIVSHHPVIFKKLAAVRSGDLVFQLIQKGISALCMHTNLDAAQGGVNDVLCDVLEIAQPATFGEEGIGRIGVVTSTNVKQLVSHCKERLNTHVKFVDSNREIQKVAVIGGSGGSMLRDAVAVGADLLVTGEASHHDALDAQSMGIGLIVAGHYATEFPIVSALADKLQKQFPDVQVLCSQQNKDPYQYA